MEPEEVFAEVKRRKQRASDLKIREILWDLEKRFRGYSHWLRDDPQFAALLIFPGVKLSENKTGFVMAQTACQLAYNRGRVSSDDLGDTDSQTTYATITLIVNNESVFEFEVSETTVYGRFEPSFYDSVGEVIRFIEGPWVTEVADFVKNVHAHEQQAWKVRNAPRDAEKAADLKKRFGL